MLKRVTDEVATLEDDLLSGVDVGERTVSPLLASVSFIDFAHRFGHIMEALPLVKKKAPELLRLKAALGPVEEARNYLQHLREAGELSSNAPIEFSVFGSLAWTHGDAAFVIAFAQSSPNVTQISPAFDAFNQRWTATHEYRVKNARINLQETLQEMKMAYEWLAKKITGGDPAFTALSWGSVQSFCFRMSITVTTLNANATPPPIEDSESQ